MLTLCFATQDLSFPIAKVPGAGHFRGAEELPFVVPAVTNFMIRIKENSIHFSQSGDLWSRLVVGGLSLEFSTSVQHRDTSKDINLNVNKSTG